MHSMALLDLENVRGGRKQASRHTGSTSARLSPLGSLSAFALLFGCLSIAAGTVRAVSSAGPTFSGRPPAGSSAHPSRVIVVKAMGKATASAAGSLSSIKVETISANETVSEAVRRLNASPDVAWAAPDLPIVPTAVPNDRYYSEQWGLHRVGASAAWDSVEAVVAAGANAPVTVCIADTGVDASHPDLAGSLAGPAYNALDGSSNVMDDMEHGHGTHIAGIIAAASNNGALVAGLAWKSAVKVLPCKFMGLIVVDGKPQQMGYTSGAVACIQWCLKQGASVISGSFSSGTQENPALQAAIQAASSALVVLAAGNQKYNMQTTPTYPAVYSRTMPHVLTVGASSARSDNSLAYFSNYDPSSVQLSAPGEGILSTVPGGGNVSWSGTSMAAPFVSAAAAVLKAASGGRLTPLQLRDYLTRSAQSVPSQAGKTYYGLLRVDSALALAARESYVPQAVRPSPSPSPKYKTVTVWVACKKAGVNGCRNRLCKWTRVAVKNAATGKTVDKSVKNCKLQRPVQRKVLVSAGRRLLDRLL